MIELLAEGYFILNSTQAEHRVCVRERLGGCVSVWESGARVSPVYSFTHDDISPSTLNSDFAGRCTLAFCGPYNADALVSRLPSPIDQWVTLGLYNLVSLYGESQEDEISEFESICENANIPWETWDIQDGIVANVRFSAPSEDDGSWREELSRLDDIVEGADIPAYYEVFRETICELATTHGRLPAIPSAPRKRLAAFCGSAQHLVTEWLNDDAGNSRENLGVAQKLNSSLSRLITEAFAGSSPLLETRCHYWSNSLFGIGVPTLALQALLHSLGGAIADQRIAERVAAFAFKPPDDFKPSKAPRNFLDTVTDAELEKVADFDDPVNTPIPMLGYFSAREGFRRTEHSISAPLTSVACAATEKWSLRSITHEVSHGIVAEIISEVFPFMYGADMPNLDTLAEKVQQRRAKSAEDMRPLTLARVDAANLLENVAIDIASAAVLMRWPEGESFDEQSDLNAQRLTKCIERSYIEINEVLAHIIDVLYFYDCAADKYVKSIWSAWGKIPHIESRTENYLRRTICAVAATMFSNGNGFDEAFCETHRLLRELNDEMGGSAHVEFALGVLERNEKNSTYQTSLKHKVYACASLVSAAQRYFYSEGMAGKIHDAMKLTKTDQKLSPNATGHSIVEHIGVTPAKLVMEYGYSNKYDPIASACLLHSLAFCEVGR